MSPIRLALLLASLCVATLAVCAWAGVFSDRGEAPVPARGSVVGEDAELTPLRGPALGPARGDEGEDRPATIGRSGDAPNGAVRFPDGTWLPALNGVTDPPPFQGWDPERPYSPVVGIVAGGGLQWYRHADGSKSTVRRFPLESERGVEIVTGWGILHPTEAKPLDRGR